MKRSSVALKRRRNTLFPSIKVIKMGRLQRTNIRAIRTYRSYTLECRFSIYHQDGQKCHLALNTKKLLLLAVHLILLLYNKGWIKIFLLSSYCLFFWGYFKEESPHVLGEASLTFHDIYVVKSGTSNLRLAVTQMIRNNIAARLYWTLQYISREFTPCHASWTVLLRTLFRHSRCVVIIEAGYSVLNISHHTALFFFVIWNEYLL